MQDLFPHETIREGQDILLKDVKEALADEEQVIAHAPTGLGKTAAVISPAIAHALANNRTVFFLTARHAQHEMALETCRRIKKKHDVTFTVVDLIGKQWLCNVEHVEEMGSRDFQEYCQTVREEERCPYYAKTRSFETQELTSAAKQKMKELQSKVLGAEEMKQEASDFCPYYLQLAVARDADVVIADYYHLFHPNIRTALLSRMNRAIEDLVVIVDEAHNLPDRVRSLLSTQVTHNTIRRARKEASIFGFPALESDLTRLEQRFPKWIKEATGKEREVVVEKGAFGELIADTIGQPMEAMEDLEMCAEAVREKKEKSSCSALAGFLEEWEGEDAGYARIASIEQTRKGNALFTLRYSCLDPQVSTEGVFDAVRTAILMSGTLTPTELYRDLLGLNRAETRERTYESPFSDENRLDLVVPTVTTKYSERTEKEFGKIGWYVKRIAEAVPGNVGVFFPSYALRDQISKTIELSGSVLREKRAHGKQERNELLETFAGMKKEGATLLGVISGSFDQGVDYPGAMMRGVVIVGLPLGTPDLETQQLIDFYDFKFDKGWDYGYIYPAMNRTLQAAGRCIRSKEDRGVIAYLDKRYLWGNYRKAFPPERNLVKTRAPWKEIETFFGDV